MVAQPRGGSKPRTAAPVERVSSHITMMRIRRRSALLRATHANNFSPPVLVSAWRTPWPMHRPRAHHLQGCGWQAEAPVISWQLNLYSTSDL